jgi:hypothetical protein
MHCTGRYVTFGKIAGVYKLLASLRTGVWLFIQALCTSVITSLGGGYIVIWLVCVGKISPCFFSSPYYHKAKRMVSALKFLARYAQEGDGFVDSIVTGDETWGFHHTPESKQKSVRCKKKSWRGSKGRRQTSMTRGCRSWFQDLIMFGQCRRLFWKIKLCKGSPFTVLLL